MSLSAGALFANRFEIDRLAGRGGMGSVYRAHDRLTGAWVALKLLASPSHSRQDSDRFAREAQLLSELQHPVIVSHVAHGETADGLRFLAMELLEGEDLAQRLMRGPLPLLEARVLLERIAAALTVAHQQGVIHRDRRDKPKIWLPSGYITLHQRRTDDAGPPFLTLIYS